MTIYKLKNYKYGVNGYIAKKDKIYIHIISKYVNCGDNYQITTFKYPVKQKT